MMSDDMSAERIRSGPELHVGRPNLGDRELFDRLVDGVFQRRWFTNGGQLVQQLEHELCQHLGVKHCILVCNATSGLQLACRALNLTGEIILPAFTFIATAHAPAMENLTPVFADVDLATHCLCPDHVRALVNERTSAILGVHLWGNPCAVEALKAIADEFDLKLIFDAAHAFHNCYNGTMIGNFGDCEVFSFHATKFFHTFEGGAVATNDDRLAEQIRLLKNFGFAGAGNVVGLGTNAKLPEVSAAMGLSMLPQIDQLADINRRNYLAYRARLHAIPGLKLFDLSSLPQCNWQYIVLEIDAVEFGCSRDQLLDSLIENQVLAKPYFSPGCHRMNPFQEAFAASGRSLPNTDQLCERTICLPTGASITPIDIDQVCQIIQNRSASFGAVPRHGKEISRKAAG